MRNASTWTAPTLRRWSSTAADAGEREAQVSGGGQDQRSGIRLIDIEREQSGMVLHVELDRHLVFGPLARGLVERQPDGSISIECFGLHQDLHRQDVGIREADFASDG